MTHRLTTNYAKKYCNRTLIVKVIVENVVTCFLLGHGVEEIFEIRSGIEIIANYTKIYQIYQYNSTMNTNIRTGGSSSFKRYEWVSYL